MLNESVEFDIKVNGKPAEKSIKDVEDAQNDLDKTVDRTSTNIKTNWKAIGVAAAAATVALGAMMKQSIELERVLFGLNEQTREWIKNLIVTKKNSKAIEIRDYIAHLETELKRAASEAHTFQSIDSAPKDGTVIDLWVAAKDCEFRAPDFKYDNGRFVGATSDEPLSWHYGNVGMLPTHWMTAATMKENKNL